MLFLILRMFHESGPRSNWSSTPANEHKWSTRNHRNHFRPVLTGFPIKNTWYLLKDFRLFFWNIVAVYLLVQQAQPCLIKILLLIVLAAFENHIHNYVILTEHSFFCSAMHSTILQTPNQRCNRAVSSSHLIASSPSLPCTQSKNAVSQSAQPHST